MFRAVRGAANRTDRPQGLEVVESHPRSTADDHGGTSRDNFAGWRGNWRHAPRVSGHVTDTSRRQVTNKNSRRSLHDRPRASRNTAGQNAVRSHIADPGGLLASDQHGWLPFENRQGLRRMRHRGWHRCRRMDWRVAMRTVLEHSVGDSRGLRHYLSLTIERMKRSGCTKPA